MAKTGQLLPTAIGTASPNIAKYPTQGGWYPYSVNIVNSLGGGKVTRGNNKPTARTIKGQLLPCYFNDFYFRVHVLPTSLDVGNIVSAQEYEVYVWNAHLNSKRLTAINGISEGLIVEGKQAPYTFNPLEEQLYKLTITPEGATRIDDTIIWNFNDEQPSLVITGDRVIAFAFMPDWSDEIVERLEWATDILTSESGIEQRSALYLSPRRQFKSHFIFYQGERQYFNNMMSWSSKVWVIPLWPYIQFIKTPVTKGDTFIACVTEDIEFNVNGLIILWRDTYTYEIVEVAAIAQDGLTLARPLQNDWTAGTRLYPAKTAMFSKQPSITRKTDSLQTASIEFRLTENSPYSATPPTAEYLGYPVFELLPDESSDLNSQYQRVLTTLDNGMALPKVTDVSGYSFFLQAFRWFGMGREERRQFRQLAYYLNGRQKALWIPSHADDLTIVERISATEPLITINNCGYSRFASNDPDKKHIAIYLTDHSVIYRAITNSEELGDKERLVLDSPLGIDINPEQVYRVCYIRLCRSNSDSLEIKHITDSQGVATSQLTFRRVRDNEL